MNIIIIYTGTGVLFIYMSQRSLKNVKIYDILLRLRQKLHLDQNPVLAGEERKKK